MSTKKAQKSKAVRVSEESYATLVSLSRQNETSLTETIDMAIAALERERFFEELNAACLKFQQSDHYAAFKEEMREWDATLGDGLENL